MTTRPLTVAWISYFPVEWLPDGVPDEVMRVPIQHPGSWQRVLLGELEKAPGLQLHIVVVRKQFARNLTFVRNGVTFHLIRIRGGGRATSLFWADTMAIGRVLRSIQPDVVHAWGTEQGAALVARRLGYPHVVTVQGLLAWYGLFVKQSGYERLAAFLEKFSLARAPLVTSEARFSVQWVRHRNPRARVEQVEHAPDWAFHQVRRQPQTKPLRFVFVGALDHRKGGDLVARALDQLRGEMPFELIVVGRRGRDVEETLARHVSREFWPQVVFKQNLTHLQVAEELRTATLALCPSRADVSPNAVKEAVVAGVPVVATTVGGIPDYVLPGLNGLLCAPDSLAELTAALRAAAQHPKFSRGEVDAATLVKMRDYLSPKLMAQRFLETYRLALAQK